MTFRRVLVLVGVALFGALGDIALSHGMKQVGAISAERWTVAVAAVFTPWVALGILLLMAFFASYLTALSWADLTFVLPATAFGYVVVALLGQFLLGEDVTLTRWVGILLVTAGVGFVASGPSLTVPERSAEAIIESAHQHHAGGE
jgi:drug/metabolite transporter (DMT)-like permease